MIIEYGKVYEDKYGWRYLIYYEKRSSFSKRYGVFRLSPEDTNLHYNFSRRALYLNAEAKKRRFGDIFLIRLSANQSREIEV